MKNFSTGRLGRLFFNAVTLESRSPGSVVINKESGRDPGTLRAAKHSSVTLCDERQSGFTLIELLVVVLIIGILSAVALPQYQKAVEKARVTEVVTNVRAFITAVDLLLLENGGYPSTEMGLQDMSIKLSGGSYNARGDFETKNFSYEQGGCGSGLCGVEIYSKRSDYAFVAEWNNLNNDQWDLVCYTGDTDLGAYICKSLEPQGWRTIVGGL